MPTLPARLCSLGCSYRMIRARLLARGDTRHVFFGGDGACRVSLGSQNSLALPLRRA